MANVRTEYCRACGKPVPITEKKCPYCGTKRKIPHPALYTVIALLVAAILFGSSNSSEPEKIGERSNPSTQAETQAQPTTPEKSTFGKGDVVRLNDVAVTLVQVSESYGSGFNKPTDGNVFVLCEFEIENNSSKDVTISSMLSFEAYHDDYAANMSLGALVEKGNRNQLDGTVAAGKKFNGVVGYEFPDDWHELEIKFTPDFWRGKDITFVYNRGY